jgi:F-type H+-transporting ATPase subunit epsilon
VARSPFPVEVLTPEGSVFSGEVEMLSTRTEVGEIGVLANHTPLLAMLAPADLRLHISETDVKHYAQDEGYLQVHDNRALVLVEHCFEPDQIDRAEQEERLRKAETVLAEAKTPADLASERSRVALRDKRRAETFLRIAAGGPAG